MDENGDLIKDVIWVNSTLEFPMVINKFLVDFIEKSEEDNVSSKYENIYTEEQQKDSIIATITNITSKMKNYFNEIINKNDE